MNGWALAFVSGILTGVVSDTNRHPAVSVMVHLQSESGKEIATTLTDSTGAYRFAPEPGTYVIRVEDSALDEGRSEPSTVRAERTTTVNLQLRPAPYFDKAEFTVAGVTDNTYRGGHGSDNVLRSSESLTRATAALTKPDPADMDHPLETIRKLQAAAEADPSEANLFNLGTELLAHNTPQAAAEVYTQGVRRFPQSLQLLLGLAAARYAAGEYQQAADFFFRAADAAPDNPLPYRFLSQVQRPEITQLSGYQQRLARFAQLHPSDALALFWYATSLSDQQQRRPLLQRTIALDPNLAPAHLQLGILDSADRKYSAAIDEYLIAIRIQPDLEEAHYRLSEACRLIGDTSRAQQERDVYRRLSKASADRLEQQRRQLQQFVVTLKAQ